MTSDISVIITKTKMIFTTKILVIYPLLQLARLWPQQLLKTFHFWQPSRQSKDNQTMSIQVPQL